MPTAPLLPESWDAAAAGERLLAGLITVTEPHVKGAHDSAFIILDGKAFIVYMANDVQPGEAAHWPFVYCVLTVVDLATGRCESTTTFAASEKAYANRTLPVGACFVPRLVQKDADTLRCFFASEDPNHRQSQTCFIDYDLRRGDFIWELHHAELQTSLGIFPMQPQHLYNDAVAHGFTRDPVSYGLYTIDGFKRFDDRICCVLNNYPGGQNAWARLDPTMTRFEVLGHFIEPADAKLTEAAVNRLPDGRWLAISRQENRDHNYMFSESADGHHWSPHTYRDCVQQGTHSKPTLDCFGGLYYMGWNEAERVDGAHRSVFNIDVSRDGCSWERKYHIRTANSFQYPTFQAAAGAIYVSVTQGDHSDSRKERIMFGKVEELPAGHTD